MSELYSHQIDALSRMHNGCVLVGKVGSGKSRTALAYYKTKVDHNKVCYIITTAKKRDSREWEEEISSYIPTESNEYFKYVIDSWNNIKKHIGVKDSFFIFDEQRVVGCGAWVKSFYKITKQNEWILLTATPGDTWSDYIPVFVANGYYRNKTDFSTKHIVLKPYMKYPVVSHYVDQGILLRHRNDVLVLMDFERSVEKFNHDIQVEYNKKLYKRIFKDRWDIYDDEPIWETGKLCYLLRKVTNCDPSRVGMVKELLKENPKSIVFYNFTYELVILRRIAKELGYEIGEWNGEKHTELPIGDKWVYLCQYTAAAEGWNCITTNIIIFYSQNYSYKTTVQAAGRIDRINTPFSELHYYYLRSSSPIDLGIRRALSDKRNFNEKMFMEG